MVGLISYHIYFVEEYYAFIKRGNSLYSKYYESFEKWISIETDSGRKESHKKRYDELEELLTKKLDEYGDFKG